MRTRQGLVCISILFLLSFNAFAGWGDRIVWQKPDFKSAQWHFGVGFMPQEDKFGEVNLNWHAQLGGDIPLYINYNPFVIETGLRFLNKAALLDGGGYNSFAEMAGVLELPVRLGYDYPLGRDFSLRFSAGPYLSYMFRANGLHFGVEPSLMLKYKNVGFGLQYSAPLVKGYTNEIGNTIMATFSVRFGKKAWKGIGIGVAVAGATALAVAAAFVQQDIDQTASPAYVNDRGDVFSDNAETDDAERKDQAKARKERAEEKAKLELENRQRSWEIKNSHTYTMMFHSALDHLASIHAGSATYSKYSIKEIQAERREWQAKIKEYRATWKEKTGYEMSKVIPVNVLENWNPSDAEIARIFSK